MIEMAERTETEHLVDFNIQSIMACLPHRYPFLLVDRVTAHNPGKTIYGYKNITMNEPFFQGHFPGKPIMPGVLIVEALAQLGCILVLHLPEGQDKLVMFAGIDGIRFRRPVIPGDKLELFAELLKLKGPVGKAYGKATVNGELVADGEILFSLVPNQ